MAATYTWSPIDLKWNPKNHLGKDQTGSNLCPRYVWGRNSAIFRVVKHQKWPSFTMGSSFWRHCLRNSDRLGASFLQICSHLSQKHAEEQGTSQLVVCPEKYHQKVTSGTIIPVGMEHVTNVYQSSNLIFARWCTDGYHRSGHQHWTQPRITSFGRLKTPKTSIAAISTNTIWLVVSSLPLWKIWKSLGMMKFPIYIYIYMEKWKMLQTFNKNDLLEIQQKWWVSFPSWIASVNLFEASPVNFPAIKSPPGNLSFTTSIHTLGHGTVKRWVYSNWEKKYLWYISWVYIWIYNQLHTIIDNWVCLKLGIHPSYGYFNRDNDD